MQRTWRCLQLAGLQARGRGPAARVSAARDGSGSAFLLSFHCTVQHHAVLQISKTCKPCWARPPTKPLISDLTAQILGLPTPYRAHNTSAPLLLQAEPSAGAPQSSHSHQRPGWAVKRWDWWRAGVPGEGTDLGGCSPPTTCWRTQIWGAGRGSTGWRGTAARCVKAAAPEKQTQPLWV